MAQEENLAAAGDKNRSQVPQDYADPAVLSAMDMQPRVRDFFCVAAKNKSLSHAYLFLGAPGAGMNQAARALGQYLVCSHNGCGVCDECKRVLRNSHPDVKFIDPESSVSGYLISQIRDLLADVSLAPVRAQQKLYVITRADLLKGVAANALLKTIEEPPEGVNFIFIARTADSVLSTIVSRCQEIPFRILPYQVAQAEVEKRCGTTGTAAQVALAVAGSADKAVNYLASPQRQDVRGLGVRILGNLFHATSWDCLVYAHELAQAIEIPLEDVRSEQEEQAERARDFLSSSAMKLVEKANKRELTAKQKAGIIEALRSIDSVLRDVLLCCENMQDTCINKDVIDVVQSIAGHTTSASVVEAIEVVSVAMTQLTRNVTPQLTLEVMLLNIKEALYAHRYSG